MITVWGRKNSSNVKKVLWALEELNINYQQKDVGGAFGGLDTPEYLQMNPNGVIPTYQDGELTLWESNAIIRYIAAKYGEKTLSCDNLEKHAITDMWMDWAGTNLFPLIQQMMKKIVRTPKEQQDPQLNTQILSEINHLMSILDAHLAQQTYVGGDQFGIADIALAPLIYPWHEVIKVNPSFLHIDRWFDLLAQRPAYREIVMIPVN